MVDVTGSTQNDLVNGVRASNTKPGDVLVSEYQSQGKGRLDRTFEAAPLSALLFSFFVEPKISSEDYSWLPLVAGLAVVKAIDSCCELSTGERAMLKWPNDVLIADKKVAGLIAEKVENHGVVIGIGINVGMNESELPVAHATSLELEGCRGCDRNHLLVQILKEFDLLVKRLESSVLEVKKEYELRCSTINSHVRVEHPGGSVTENLAIGVDPTGALLLSDGQHVSAGDILHIRT